VLTAPVDDLRRVADAQARFEAAISSLDDARAASPCLLPGWTIGHLLTHVARNADSHIRRIEGARRGAVVEQYVGGFEGRARDIEQGAARSASDLIADVRDTAQRLAGAWPVGPDAAWSMVSADVSGRERRLHDLPGRRWQELEVHLVDLGTGPTIADWPDDFVHDRLPELRDSLAERLAQGAEPPSPGSLNETEELAWLYGRLTRPDLPELAPWR
jgi:maleylpyruvate isomerase